MDFYNIKKVDNHIHHSAAMSASHLRKFITQKYNEEADTKVIRTKENGVEVEYTLKELFDKIKMDPHHISIDLLDVQADTYLFQRFDRFNAKYKIGGSELLRKVFVKNNSNLNNGKFMAELTK